MKYRVVVTARARADALKAFLWLADQSPDVAERWYAGLEKAIGTLKTFPKRHSIAEDESEQLGVTVRQMLYGRRRGIYRVFFSVEGDTVTLHYVRHSAQGLIEP